MYSCYYVSISLEDPDLARECPLSTDMYIFNFFFLTIFLLPIGFAHARPDRTVSYFQQLNAPICELIYKLLLLYLWLALIQFNGYLSINHFERQVSKKNCN